jgi:hypothetical protein
MSMVEERVQRRLAAILLTLLGSWPLGPARPCGTAGRVEGAHDRQYLGTGGERRSSLPHG